MPRLDEVGAVRIPASRRQTMFTAAQLEGMGVWLQLAHRQLVDCATYRLAEAGLLVVDESDDAELHLDQDAVAMWMDTGAHGHGPVRPAW